MTLSIETKQISTTVMNKCIKLKNGCEMPVVGLGTWRAQPQEIEIAIESALENGYRHIDTAFNYNTEESIGKIIGKWIASGKGKREDLFITSKLPNFGNRPRDVKRFLELSLKKLNLSYLDLYLIHMPFSFQCNETTMSPLVNEDGTFCLDINNDIIGTWKEMEKQVKSGLTKAIGLSNFNAEQVQRIHEAAEIEPAVLQVELHAYLQQKSLRRICENLKIAVTAYSPLGSPGANTHFSMKYNYKLDNFPNILENPVGQILAAEYKKTHGQILLKHLVQENVIVIPKSGNPVEKLDNFPNILENQVVQTLAAEYKKTPGQILLKHLVQENVIVIPKSGNPERIKTNIDLFDFELSKADLTKLDDLDKHEAGRIFNFLFFKGVEKHPEYPFEIKKAE